ncbi:hypothetical protein UFOVP6_25 [uncultured Caudovirales phage]|uniref:Transglycosylase SLT domain-containing protein n=1 Tax=uncultured Caudovirales phage TaxID=2100421 RepID=A0A6J5KLB3_9CAUD|nr:hypothetical protein UFOVP6_25 [uncultured Caudovirales phage]
MAQIVSIAGSVQPEASPVTRAMPMQEASGSDFGGQIGQSMQGLGQQIGNAVNVFAQDMHQRQQFTTEANWSDWQSAQQADFDKAAEGISGTNAMGFTAQRAQQSDAAFKDFLATVPENDRPRVQAKYADYKRVMTHQALVTELQTADTFYGVQIKDKLDKFSTGIAQNPATAQTYIDQGAAFIDASGLPPGVKEQLKKDWVQNAAGAKANGLLTSDPQKLADTLASNGSSSPEDFIKRMSGSESSNNPAAENSGHYGLMQLSSDWIAKAGEAGVIPKGMTPEQFKADTAAQDKANVWYMGQVDKYIMSKGYVEKGYSLDGLRAVAHLGGLGGLDKFVSTGGKYNPNDGHTSLTDYYNKFSGTAHDPVLANLSYADTLKFKDQAASQLNQNAQAAAAQQRVAHDTMMNNLGIMANSGQMSVEQVDALTQNGTLKDIDDVTKLQGLIKSYGERQGGVTFAQNILSATGPVNGQDADVQKAGNAWTSRPGATFEDGMTFYNRTGYLPDKTSNALFGMTVSTDPKLAQQGAAVLGNILAQNGPNALAGANHSTELAKTGAAYNHFVNDLNMSPEEAAKRLARMNDPAFHTDVQDKQVTSFQDKLLKDPSAIVDRVTSAFDSVTGWGGVPQAGVDSRQIGQLTQDYIDLASERFRETGDEELSKAYAMDIIHGKDGKPGLYGVSNGVMTKYPAEAVTPAMPDGSHDYVYSQAAAEVKALDKVDVDPKDIVLVPLPGNITGEAWRRGGLSGTNRDRTETFHGVPYQIVYKHPDTGVYEPLAVAPGQAFIPDATSAYAEYTAAAKEKNAVDTWNKYVAQKAAADARRGGSAGRTATTPLKVMDPPPKPASIIAQEKAAALAPPSDAVDPAAAAKAEQEWMGNGPGTEFFGVPIGGN